MSEEKTKIVFLVETPMWKSIASDIFTLAVIGAVFAPGVYLESSAMQWCGFAMLVLMGLVRSGSRKMTPEQLHKYLNEKYSFDKTER